MSAPPVKVVANGVSDDVVQQATQVHQNLFGRLAPANAELLGKFTIELHIVPDDKKLTDLPQYQHLTGKQSFESTPERPRTWDEIRGAGGMLKGTTIYFAVSEEEISRGSLLQGATGNQHFPWFGPEFLQHHESGHIIYDFGLTAEQRATVDQLYAARKADANAAWLKPGSYTAANPEEYFSNSVAAFFSAPHSVAGDPDYTPDWLRTNDPKMYDLLRAVFPGTPGTGAATGGAPVSVPVAPPPKPAWDTVDPGDIPPELRPQPPPPPPADPHSSRYLRRPGCLLSLGLIVVLLIGTLAAIALTGGRADEDAVNTAAGNRGGRNGDAIDDPADDPVACALHTVLTLLGIDKVPGQYHQGNIAVDVRDAANAPVDGAVVDIRTEKSDNLPTTASGSTQQGRVVFAMRTTRFGSNALIVTGVTKPGCTWTPSPATDTLRWDAVP